MYSPLSDEPDEVFPKEESLPEKPEPLFPGDFEDDEDYRPKRPIFGRRGCPDGCRV